MSLAGISLISQFELYTLAGRDVRLSHACIQRSTYRADSRERDKC